LEPTKKFNRATRFPKPILTPAISELKPALDAELCARDSQSRSAQQEAPYEAHPHHLQACHQTDNGITLSQS
jgi:hypothetical protein